MNIVKQEFKMTYKSLIYYTASMLAMVYIFLMFFETFSKDTAMLNELLSNFPQEFKAAFGFADVDLSKISGYLSFLFGYIVLFGAVYGMKLGISVLSEEARAKTADFLLSKPVKRLRVAAAKLSAVFVCIILQNILLYALILPVAMSKANGDLDIKIFTLMSFSVFLVQIFFVGIGMFISVLMRKIKSVMPVTLAVVFMFFIIELINQSLLEEKLTYLTPFSYFKGSDIISRIGYDPKYLAIDIAIFVIFTFLSFIIYKKKDVRAV